MTAQTRLTVALDDTDRRRFLLAAIVTMLALPALWWASREDAGTGPTVATAGVDVDAGPGTVESTTAPQITLPVTTVGRSNLPTVGPVTSEAPIFLDGPAPSLATESQIAIPGRAAIAPILTSATFRSTIAGSQNCFAIGVQSGQTVTVVNLDNNRSTTCTVTLAPASQTDPLVLHTDRFVELADLTDAPIPVEIRQ